MRAQGAIVEDEVTKMSEWSAGRRAAEAAPAPSPLALRGNLSAAAQRALAEAEERRRRPPPALPPETNGRGGPEPVRYGDWEVNGLATDF